MKDSTRHTVIRKIKTRTPWGKALEVLRVDKRHVSINRFEATNVMRRSAYRSLLKGVNGPTVRKLDQVFTVLGCTWQHWAEVYESVKRRVR